MRRVETNRYGDRFSLSVYVCSYYSTARVTGHPGPATCPDASFYSMFQRGSQCSQPDKSGAAVLVAIIGYYVLNTCK